MIPTNLIDSPGRDARIGLDPEKYEELKKSIRENGVLQPILVRPRADRYEVIAGHRRLRVARELGLASLPALVRAADDTSTSILRLEENARRADLSPVEEAKYYAETLVELGLSPADFAAKIGHTEQWVRDRLSIADMPTYLQDYLHAGKMSIGVALALAAIDDERTRREWSWQAATYGMTVLSARNALREYQKMAQRAAATPDQSLADIVPLRPPTVMVDCVRCGSQREANDTRFVRICSPDCPAPNSNSTHHDAS